MSYADAMRLYGSDKPDTRFGMAFVELNELVKDSTFQVFSNMVQSGGLVAGICASGCGNYTRKQLDELTDFVKDARRGMTGLIYAKMENGQIKSSVDKFFTPEQLVQWASAMNAKDGDLLLILAGETEKDPQSLG